MWSLTRLRQHPHFAPLFGRVHPLCWLILWWQLNGLIRWFETHKPDDVLYSVSPWGLVTIRYVAPRTDPRLYTPRPRTFRVLTDPSWGSDLPACVDPGLAPAHALILPRARGKWPEGPEGAIAPIPNTS